MSARTSKPERRTRRRVLIVDDHPFVRAGLRDMLDRQHDFVVCAEAGNVREALRAGAEQKPDVAVVDLSLEGRSGLDLIRKLRQLDPQLAILVLSMHDESLQAEHALRAGAHGYIMKRESPHLFVVALRQVASGQLYLSETMTARLMRSQGRQRTAPATPMQRLSGREQEVLLLIGQGHRRSEIAKLLSLSAKTVETHFERIKTKLGYRDAHELRRQAFLLTQERQTDAARRL